MSGERVGVVGNRDLLGSVETAGGEAHAVVPEELDGVDVVVVAGEEALVDLARASVDVPVLPVDVDGVRSVPRESVEDAVTRMLGGEVPTERHPVVAAEDGFQTVRGLFDVALMAAEPARISEFSVRCGGEEISRFRADGVVASTPAGSVGYNRSAGGAVVAPGTDVLSVVPVAPFATNVDKWILPIEEVTLSVERDETPVELLVDGRIERTVETGDPVTLARAGAVRTVAVPEGEPFF